MSSDDTNRRFGLLVGLRLLALNRWPSHSWPSSSCRRCKTACSRDLWIRCSQAKLVRRRRSRWRDRLNDLSGGRSLGHAQSEGSPCSLSSLPFLGDLRHWKAPPPRPVCQRDMAARCSAIRPMSLQSHCIMSPQSHCNVPAPCHRAALAGHRRRAAPRGCGTALGWCLWLATTHACGGQRYPQAPGREAPSLSARVSSPDRHKCGFPRPCPGRSLRW